MFLISIVLLLSCKQQEDYNSEPTEAVVEEGPVLVQGSDLEEVKLYDNDLETYIIGEWKVTDITAKQDLDNEGLVMLDALKGVYSKLICKFYNDGTYIIKDPYEEDEDEYGTYKIFGDGEYVNLTKEGGSKIDRFIYNNNKLYFKYSYEYLDLEIEFTKE
jgi:hypothetical protein